MVESLEELWELRWPHFKPHEVLSPDGLEYFRRGHMVMQTFFLDKLHQFRNYLTLPFLMNHGALTLRGWRSHAENASIGGKLYHPLGVAADVTVKDLSPQELAEHALDFGFHGVGLYPTFVHIDLRPRLRNEAITWGFGEN